MIEFSTTSMLEVEVDQRSLRNARQTVEDRVGSVRANTGSSPRTDGGQRQPSFVDQRASRERAMTRNLLAAQLEKLGDIEEKIEKMATTISSEGGGGGGGSGILQMLGIRSVVGGVGAGAAGTIAGASALAGGLTFGVQEGLTRNLPGGQATLQDRRKTDGPVDAFTDQAKRTVDPTGVVEATGRAAVGGAVDLSSSALQSLRDGISLDVPSVLQNGLSVTAPDWLQGNFDVSVPDWVRGAFDIQFPSWLRNAFDFEAPQWVRDLQDGFTIGLDLGDVGVTLQNIERQLQNAVRNELQNFNLEQMIRNIVREEMGLG